MHIHTHARTCKQLETGKQIDTTPKIQCPASSPPSTPPGFNWCSSLSTLYWPFHTPISPTNAPAPITGDCGSSHAKKPKISSSSLLSAPDWHSTSAPRLSSQRRRGFTPSVGSSAPFAPCTATAVDSGSEKLRDGKRRRKEERVCRSGFGLNFDQGLEKPCGPVCCCTTHSVCRDGK